MSSHSNPSQSFDDIQRRIVTALEWQRYHGNSLCVVGVEYLSKRNVVRTDPPTIGL